MKTFKDLMKEKEQGHIQWLAFQACELMAKEIMLKKKEMFDDLDEGTIIERETWNHCVVKLENNIKQFLS